MSEGLQQLGKATTNFLETGLKVTDQNALTELAIKNRPEFDSVIKLAG